MPEPGASHADVVAVLVAHDGAAWLPRTLAALARSSVRPAVVVGVDTGSRDGSADLLETACDTVLALPRATGYPAAVHAALAAVPPHRWVWLLHDDSAPGRRALEALLRHADADPSAVLLGPKARDWDDPRLLVEAGLTVDAAGHRDTGLEPGEHDQGQHDAVRDVLAVGTAGALVRRDVWDAVGGLDPALPLLRDDVDLGWTVNALGARVVVVPEAVVAHARALTTGRRRGDALAGRLPAAVDRRHALLVALAHAAPALLPLQLLAAVLGGLLRAAGLLLTRRPAAARDEVAALGLLLHPGSLVAARRRRAALRRVPSRALAPLFARRRDRLLAAVTAAGDWLGGGAAPPGDPDAGLAPDAVPADPVLRRPAVLLGAGLLAVALLAERALLPGTGPSLSGGRLLPPPDGAGGLWSAYAESGAPASALLAALASLLLGSAEAAVDVVVLLAVPAAGLSAHLAARPLVRSRALRAWGAATWALLPVATGAVAAGRLDVAAGQVLLPPLLLQAVRLLGPRPDARRPWRTGLLLGLVVALTPVLWVLAAVLLLGACLLGGLGARRLRGVLVTLAVPVVLLLPWALAAGLGDLLHGPWPRPPGLAPPVGGAALALLAPGGPGTPPAVLTLGLLLAALGGTLRSGRARRTALLAWAAALTSLAAAGVLVRLVEDGARVWPGPALQVAAAALLVAAGVAGDGLRARLERAAFGARQVTAAVVAVVAGLTPLLLAGAWVVRGADGPLTRDRAPALPAFARAELAAEPGLRALVLQPRPGAALGFAVTGAQGARLGGTVADELRLTEVVADLAAPRGSAAAAALATRAVRYVVLRPGDPALADVLDAQPGLARRAAEPFPLWQVTAPATRLQVLAPATARAARRGPPDAGTAVAGVPVDDVVPTGPPGRLLVLAEPAGEGWRVRLDGRDLRRVPAWGGVAGFVLPPEGGRVRVDRDRGAAWLLPALPAVALLAVLVLAAPRAPRTRRLELPR